MDLPVNGAMVEGECSGNVEKLHELPEFAALCSFIHHFGPDLGIYVTFPQLSQFLDGNKTILVNHKNWETLHVKLLNKLKYRARPDRWEPVLGRFLLKNASTVEDLVKAGEYLQCGTIPRPLEDSSAKYEAATRSGSPVYYKLDASTRTRILLCLLEAQFDNNQGFKEKVNQRSPIDLRFHPFGCDVWGRAYWLLKDAEINFLLYREENGGGDMHLVCQTTEDMRKLHNELKDECPDSMRLPDILAKRTNWVPRGSSDSSLKTFIAEGVFTELGQPHVHPKIESSTASNPRDPDPSLTRPPASTDCEASSPSHSPITGLALSGELEKCKVEVDENDQRSCNGGVSSQSTPRANDTATDHLVEPENGVLIADKVGKQTDIVIKPEDTKVEDTSGKKSTRQRKRLPTVGGDDGESTCLVEVRRSSRQRKPVEFLTMEPIQPKRPRLSHKHVKTATEDGKTGNPKSKKPTSRKHRPKAESATLKMEDEMRVIKAERRKKKKKKRRGHKKNKNLDPWCNRSSSSESDGEDDTFEQALLEQEYASSSELSTHKTKPDGELDWFDALEKINTDDVIDAESDTDSLAQGRNLARQKRLQQKKMNGFLTAPVPVVADPVHDKEEPCEICGKSYMPEWILLCDRCDLGHHAMCLRPPIFVIPEGDWFCPRCQHNALVTALQESADAIDAEQKKHSLWKRMQERLNFVNISMTNILADEEEDGSNTRHHRLVERPVKYRDSASDSETGSLTGDSSSDEDNHPEDGEDEVGGEEDEDASYSDEGARKHSKRKVKNLRPTRSLRRSGTSKRYYQRSSSDEVSSTSSVHSSLYAPRSTRHVQANYDLHEAFKQLDEVLENDEKYREEKVRRQHHKSDVSGEQADNFQPSNSPSAERPHGKDLSNILNEDWAELGDDGKPSAVHPKRDRKSYRLSTSSSDTESDGHKRRNRDKDVDFKPSSSESSSDAEGESEEELSESDSATSDSSWLCTSRRAKRDRSRKQRQSRGRVSKTRFRKRGRPVPRFEQSTDEDEESSRDSCIRPRRRVAVGINYKEIGDEDSDVSVPRRPVRRSYLASSEEERGDRMKPSPEAVSSPHTFRPKRRLISSDSDYQPDEKQSNEGESVKDKSSDEDTARNKNSVRKPALTSSSEEGEESKLEISENSPVYRPLPSPEKLMQTNHVDSVKPVNYALSGASQSSYPAVKLESSTTEIGCPSLPVNTSRSPDLFD